jgi:hypothetical protein
VDDGRRAIPKGTDPWAGRDAQRLACGRAYQMPQERYDQLEGQLTTWPPSCWPAPPTSRAGSAAARKKAAEPFLVPCF